MTAHKHAEMIKAKADNMDLVRISRLDENSGKGWVIQSDIVQNSTDFRGGREYFLCLPQHKDAVLNALNGGESQTYRESQEAGLKATCHDKWNSNYWYMRDDRKSRIKPRKEKRWIGYYPSTNQTFPHPQKSREVAEDYAARNYGYPIKNWQFIEIEFEVLHD